MKKVLFYCQHLLGVGHLTRSLNICREIAKENTVDFIQGGSDIGRTLDLSHFTHHFLSPLSMNEDSELYSPKGSDVSEVWKTRQEQLRKLTTAKWDHLVVELYPFGRKKFAGEIDNLVRLVRRQNPDVKVTCSLRDILVEKKNWNDRQDKIIKIIRGSFDHVWVHSDPSLIPLDLTFPKVEKIASQLVYTGFISEPKNDSATERGKQILVSTGGGVVGDSLVLALLKVAPQLPALDFVFIKSPNMSGSILRALDNASNTVKVIGFSDDYQKLLATSDLSVSLSGYNTCMNLLRTKTFGLVLPYQDSSEQILRARILENQKVLRILSPGDLETSVLSKIIEESLGKSDWVEPIINLEGASQAAHWISEN